MSEIKWETPAAAASGPGSKSRYAGIVEQLQARPGQWAVVSENASPTITRYLRDRYGLEAMSRGVKNGRAEKIYARWPEQA